MRFRLPPYLTKDRIEKRSILWLFLKGFGGTLALAIAAWAAYATVGNFNIANTTRLSEDLNKRDLQISVFQSIIDSLREQRDSLKQIVLEYNAKRFILRNYETRHCTTDVFIFLDGKVNGSLTINTTDSLIKSIPENSLYHYPIRFTIHNVNYTMLIERRFEAETFNSERPVLDSVQLYLAVENNQ